jgi:hypothetical protein
MLSNRWEPVLALMAAALLNSCAQDPSVVRLLLSTQLAIPTDFDCVGVTIVGIDGDNDHCAPESRFWFVSRSSDLPLVEAQRGGQYSKAVVFRVEAYLAGSAEGCRAASSARLVDRQDIPQNWPASGAAEVRVQIAAGCPASPCAIDRECCVGATDCTTGCRTRGFSEAFDPATADPVSCERGEAEDVARDE